MVNMKILTSDPSDRKLYEASSGYVWVKLAANEMDKMWPTIKEPSEWPSKSQQQQQSSTLWERGRRVLPVMRHQAMQHQSTRASPRTPAIHC